MKNLENYDVQEMNAREIRETEGGFIFLLYFAYKALTGGEEESDSGGGSFGGGGASGSW